MKKAVYIFTNGRLERDQNTIMIKNDYIKKYIPIENTSELYLFGEIDFNTRILDYLSQKGILLHYFNHFGYYSGTIYPREHILSGAVILQQVKFCLDLNKRLEIARKIEIGKTENILNNLKYYNSRGIELKDKIESIKKLENEFSVDNTTINYLMLSEAKIHEIYYSAFDLILKDENFKFEKRTRKPPKNNINSLISFINSIIYIKTLAEIYKTHLDPRIGYLHETNFRRFTLNLDIAEIFKSIIGDRVIFKLVNEKMLNKNNFIRNKNIDGDIISIDENGKKIILNELENKLSTTISYKNMPHKVSYQRLIRLELYKLEKHILGDSEYFPYISKW